MLLIDMGHYLLTGVAGTHLVVQIAIPGLEERVRSFPPLQGNCVTSGAFRIHEWNWKCLAKHARSLLLEVFLPSSTPAQVRRAITGLRKHTTRWFLHEAV